MYSIFGMIIGIREKNALPFVSSVTFAWLESSLCQAAVNEDETDSVSISHYITTAITSIMLLPLVMMIC